MTPALVVQERDAVVTVVIDRPDRRNALTRDVLAELTEVLSGDVVRTAAGVVLTGGGGHFSAGADFAELTGTEDDVTFDDTVSAAALAIRNCPRPVVAALHGACFGAAVDLALACDVRIADPTAYLEVPATRLGILYNPEAVLRMRRLLPADTLARLLLLGERFGADAADAAGLVSTLVPEGAAVDRAQEMLSRLTPASRDAAAATKALLADPEAGTKRAQHWEEVRRELLRSEARQWAVAGAHARHTNHEGQGAQ